jgi:hypothetical protein
MLKGTPIVADWPDAEVPRFMVSDEKPWIMDRHALVA